MFLRTETIPEKKLMGQRLAMSLADNKTFKLWSSFMPRRKEVKNNLNSDLLSLQVYPPTYNFVNFDLAATFEKWALIEVSDFNTVPAGMKTFVLPAGLYAVFLHKGPAAAAEKTFRYIFAEWLPASGYTIDNRPHFEVLGEKHRPDSDESEEEVWIPVKPRN